MRLTIPKITLINVIQICIFGLVFYNFWIIRVIGENSVLHWALFLIVLACSFKLKGLSGIVYYRDLSTFIFWVFSLMTAVSGLLVASNYSYFAKAVVDNFEYAIIMGIIVWVSKREESVNWILNILLLVFSLLAITAVFQGKYVNARLVLGLSGNSNDLGIKMVYALFCLMIVIVTTRRKFLKLSLCVGLILLYLYVVVLTSSRKSLIVSILLLLMFVLSIVPRHLSSIKRKIFIIMMPVLGIVLYRVVMIYFPTFEETKMYSRLEYSSEGLATRLELINESIEMFKRNPVFGIGLNNFKVYSSSNMYSHSTFAETIACTGVVGFILFSMFFISIILRLFSLLKQGNKNKVALRMSFTGIIVIAVLSLGIIVYYDYASMLMLAVIISVIVTSNTNKEEEREN